MDSNVDWDSRYSLSSINFPYSGGFVVDTAAINKDSVGTT